MTRFHLLMIGVLIAIGVTTYVRAPAAGLPVHWAIDGNPDLLWPQVVAAGLFPLIALFLALVFAAIGRFVPKPLVEPGRRASDALLTGFLALLAALQLGLVLIAVGSDIDLVRIVGFVMAALLLGLGIALFNAPPNAYAGVRLPWPVGDRRHWRAAHRATGAVTAACGLGLGAACYFWPQPVAIFEALAAATVLPLLLGGLFSLAHARL